MEELKPIGTSQLKAYSRNSGLPVYTDSSGRSTFLGLNINSAVVEAKSSDQKYSIDVKYAFRPDLLSYKYYRTPLLGWYICQSNSIVDPFDPETGLYSGRQINIPSLDSMF